MRHEDFFGSAKWIEASDVVNMPLFRKSFDAGKVKNAKLNIIGLGVFVAFMNGKRISNDLFVPLNTDYHKRRFLAVGHPFEEELRHRMYVCSYDVTEFMQIGKNALCVMLGPGWYADIEQETYGRMKLCFQLTFEDENGSHVVYSDESVRSYKSYIVSASLLCGEVQRLYFEQLGWLEPDYDDSFWQDVYVVKTPETEFYLQEGPVDREIREIVPKLIFESEGIKRYDVGENISGYVVLRDMVDEGKYGDVSVVMSEELLSDGTLDLYRGYGQVMTYSVNLTHHDEYKPMFTWQAFRYFEVQGTALEAVKCVVVHSDVDVTSSFNSSNEVLNWLNEAYTRTQLCNMHMGVPSDCPHAERRGYTGDGQLACESAMLMLDAKGFYKKWIADISDCQDRKSGHVQYTAPYTQSGGGPGGWGCSIVVVPYVYYKMYGDAQPIREMFDQMIAYLGFLKEHSENNLVTSDTPDGVWVLGDWCTAEKISIPDPYVNTYFYVKSIDNILEIAKIIGREEYNEELIATRKVLCDAIIREYYDEKTGDFANNYQASNAFAIDIGLGDERTFNNMVNYYKEYGMYDSGIFGTEILTRILFERGQSELAYALLTSKGKYSFHHMMESKATTIWEYWTGRRSHSHPMFGASCRFLYQYILGIRQQGLNNGFEKFIVNPAYIPALENATGSITTPKGVVKVSRKNNGEGIDFTVEIPSNCDAEFIYADYKQTLKSGVNNINISKR